VSTANRSSTAKIKPREITMIRRIVIQSLMLLVIGLGSLAMPSWARAQDDVTPQTESEVVVVQPGETLTAEEALALSRKQQKWATLVASLTIFVLAIFIGFELITKVPPTLHTPLMSGSNAISGISIVGALLVAAGTDSGISAFFGFIAVTLATVNVVGGYLVTHRMLEMFGGRR
jgi:NAD(P) transhydrogenase subunit alpha